MRRISLVCTAAMLAAGALQVSGDTTAKGATPVQPVSVSAGVSDSRPHAHESITVGGEFTLNGRPLAGVPMISTWTYIIGTSRCTGDSDVWGSASCTQEIVTTPPGVFIRIQVVFTYQGQDYAATTGFTPQ